VAALKGVALRTIRNAVHAGKLPNARGPRGLVVPSTALASWKPGPQSGAPDRRMGGESPPAGFVTLTQAGASKGAHPSTIR
jgi:hypothetical protein